MLRAPGEPEVGERLGVDREDRAGRAELRAHVADRRSIRERQVVEAVAVELDELSDHALVAQDARDGEDEVRRRGALGEVAVQPEADHVRNEQVDGLPEHRRFGLDAAHAPAEHAEAVDHRRVTVGADQRVRVGEAVLVEDDARQVLEVHLVNDARGGRDDAEIVERSLRPAEQRVALAVALVLVLGVDLDRLRRAERIDLHRVVDDELRREERS